MKTWLVLFRMSEEGRWRLASLYKVG